MRKRKLDRMAIAKDVTINGIVRAEGLDLSETGMYIYTRGNFINGSILDIHFTLDGEAFNISAVVQHSQPGIGIGVEFRGLDGEILDKIKQYLLIAKRRGKIS